MGLLFVRRFKMSAIKCWKNSTYPTSIIILKWIYSLCVWTTNNQEDHTELKTSNAPQILAANLWGNTRWRPEIIPATENRINRMRWNAPYRNVSTFFKWDLYTLSLNAFISIKQPNSGLSKLPAQNTNTCFCAVIEGNHQNKSCSRKRNICSAG